MGRQPREIFGGENGDDTISGGNGDDIIYGGSGNDVITPGGGTDTVYSGSGQDRLILSELDSFTSDQQLVDLGDDNDYISIRGNSNILNVKVLAGEGDDEIDGYFRYLDAGSGDDTVSITTNRDNIFCLLYTSDAADDP